MFERFTDRARRVVVLAQDEAKALNHNYIGTDGKLAHLYGLNLSRAWQLRALATWLDDDIRRRIEVATDRQISEVAPQITDGDFMATHWLVSFALQAALAKL